MSNRGASESTSNAPVRLKKPSSRASLLQDLALDSALRIGKANLKSNRPLNRNNILMANHNENMMLNLGPTLLNDPGSLKYECSLHLQKQQLLNQKYNQNPGYAQPLSHQIAAAASRHQSATRHNANAASSSIGADNNNKGMQVANQVRQKYHDMAKRQ